MRIRSLNWLFNTSLAVVCALALSAIPRDATAAPAGYAEKTKSASARDAVVARLHDLPLRFEPNRGQTDRRARFFSRFGPHTLFLTPDAAVMRIAGQNDATPDSVVRLRWLGANRRATLTGGDQLPGRSNYLVGPDRSRWQTDVPNFANVRYHDLYKGIDLVYYGKEGQLEYDLILAPGARPESLRMKVDGAERAELNPDGGLSLRLSSGKLELLEPVAYQEVPADGGGTRRQPVAVAYSVTSTGEVRFDLGAYDHHRPLVIDPQITYSSYFGGSLSDDGNKVAVDASGNAYVVGWSRSLDFPLVGALQTQRTAGTMAVVLKVNPDLPGASSLIYATYLGGNADTVGRAIAVNAAGHIFVGGDTSASDFPTTPGAFQTTCKSSGSQCSSDAFAVILDASGNALLYGTYVGGTGSDFVYDLTIDSADRMFLTGPTGSSNFPTTAGAYQTTFGGGDVTNGDAFVTELQPSGMGAGDLVYSTYLGGSGVESSWAVAVDPTGAVYVGGHTKSANFPTTTSAFSRTYSGGGANNLGDAFLAKLRPIGGGATDLLYATYLGGSQDERIEGIAVDPNSTVYVTGWTTSSTFPTTAGAFQTTFGGGTCFGSPCADTFIARFDPASAGAGSLWYSTFFGGSSFDLSNGLAVDPAGFVYIAGETASTNLPMVNPIQPSCFGGCTPLPMTDMLLAKFDFSKSGQAALVFSTYMGGADVDTGWGLAVDGNGNAYVTGQVFSNNYPTVIPFQATCNNCTSFTASPSRGDVFLTKICTANCPTAGISPASASFGNQDVGTSSAAQPITFSNSGTATLAIAGIAMTGSNAGDFAQINDCPVTLAPGRSCTVNVTFTPSATGARSASIAVTSNGSSSPVAVSLSGTGTSSVPVVGVAPSSLSFGNQTTGTTSTAQSVTVTNNGPGALTISSIGMTGTNAADFAATTTCPLSPATLALNASCTVNVRFTPTATGSRSATVTITDNGTASPQTIGVSGTGTQSQAAPWPNGYQYQATFTVAPGLATGTQTDFSAVIAGTYPDLKTVANGGAVNNTCVQTVGTRTLTVPCDLIFTADAAGLTPLQWEYDRYDATTGALTVWVKVPTLATGTVVYAWYGNAAVTTLATTPAATWNSSFRAVYHLGESTTGGAPQLMDSTAGGHDGTVTGSVNSNQQRAGQVGGSLNFASVRAWASLANANDFSFERTDAFSIAGWVQTTTNRSGTLLSKLDATSTTGWGLFQYGTATTPRFSLGLQGNGGAGNFAMVATPAIPFGWHYVVVTYTGTSTVAGMRMYVDGVSQPLTTLSDTLTVSIVNPAVPAALNGRGGSTDMSTDGFDEVRVSGPGVVFSPEWVTTSYNNQQSPAAFFSVVTGLTPGE